MNKLPEVGEPFNPYKMFVGSFIPQWLECRPEISPGAKLVYARMCRYSGRNGKCNPRQGVLAKTIGLGERQARTYIKELEEYFLIGSERLGLGKSNVYKFLSHEWMFADPERQDTADQERNDASDQEQQDAAELDGKDTAAPTLSLRESFKRINGRESAKAPFPETANQPQDQKQEKPNAEPLPTETRSDCAAPAEQPAGNAAKLSDMPADEREAGKATGSHRSDKKRAEAIVGGIEVGEDRPSWVRYVAAYYNTRDEHSILKHLKAADKGKDLTGEKVAAWCARCGTLAEWLRSNVDGTFAGNTNGRAYSNGHSNGHANGNGKAAPQYKQAPAPTIDENTLVLMAVIAQVTFKNLSIKQHSELCQAAAVELAKVGATNEIVTEKFGNGAWWYQRDWRGQRGSSPTPAQLVEVWGQWNNQNAPINGAGNGATARGTGNRIHGKILVHDPNKPVDTRVYDKPLPYFPDAIAI